MFLSKKYFALRAGPLLQDWNQCCGILVQCLSGSEKESKSLAPFRVRTSILLSCPSPRCDRHSSLSAACQVARGTWWSMLSMLPSDNCLSLPPLAAACSLWSEALFFAAQPSMSRPEGKAHAESAPELILAPSFSLDIEILVHVPQRVSGASGEHQSLVFFRRKALRKLTA